MFTGLVIDDLSNCMIDAMMRGLRALFVRGIAGLLLALAAPGPATATDFPTSLQVVAVAPGYAARPPGDERWLIYLDGPIDPGATSRIVNLVLQQKIARAVVYLNSPGGSLVTAMQVGRVLREHGFETRVGARTLDAARPGPGTCYSACPFVLAGGVSRGLEPGSTIGVHRAENRVRLLDESHFQSVVEAQAVDYLAGMGVGAELAVMMASIPHHQIRELTVDEARRLKLISEGH
jgi:hypothetical protein